MSRLLPEQTPRIREKPLTTEEIEDLFLTLQLDSENQRDRFRAMSLNSQGTEEELPRLWLTGTTEFQQRNEGEANA